MSSWALHLLGSPRLERDGAAILIQRRKVMALLVYLAVTGKSHARDFLATLFWSEHDQSSARAALRRTLSELRNTLGGELLLVGQDAIGLQPACDLWMDVNEFQEDLMAYRSHGHHPDDPCPNCITALTEAVSLYQGDFLAGFTLSNCPDFDNWQILQAEILHRELIGALRRLVLGYTTGGEIAAAIEAAQSWLALDPIDETAHRHLIQLYAWNGQRSEALRQYQKCVSALQDELGVSPLEETTRVYERIRSRKCQPLPVVSTKPTTPQNALGNLPVQLTSFVGRSGELAAVMEEISRPEVHLLTLTGPGGVGKTRLSLEVAASLTDQFSDGVFFIPLAAVRDAALVGPTIAHTLGMREARGKSPVEALKEFLHDRQLLLVLDNFEHLIKAAPLVTELLASARRVKVLATSRVLLHVYGEHLHPVLPMKLSMPGRIAQPEGMELPEAVQLFIERVRAVKADFALTDENLRILLELCTRLDGLPLAIELAAARVWQISPQAMLSQWSKESGGSPLQTLTGGPRDFPSRHMTMRNAIAWSCQLLNASEQAAFRCMGIFEGGWRQEAAEAIIAATGSANDAPAPAASSIVGLHESLLDANLIQQSEVGGEMRFSMLETIREYALERLAECGELDGLRRQHAKLFLALAEEAKPQLFGAEQVVWMNRLKQEYGNFRAAFKWAVDCCEAEIALRLGSALGKFWYIYDPVYWGEGRKWLEQALNLTPDASLPDNVRANALNEAGVLAWAQGDYGQAIHYFEACLALRKTTGDKVGISSALGNLGLVAREQFDLGRARAYQEQCLALKRKMGDQPGIATALSNLAMVVADQGDYELAIALFEESLALNRELQNMTGLTLTLHNLAGVLVENGAGDAQVLALLEESLNLSRKMESHFFLIPHTLNHLGTWSLNCGAYEQARGYFDESLRLSCQSDNKYGSGHALHGLGRLAHLGGRYAQAQKLYLESISTLREINGLVGIIWNFICLADLACAHGQAMQAATLLGASEKLRETTSICLPLTRRAAYDGAAASARSRLDTAIYGEAWAKGRQMPVAQAIAYALGEKE